MPKLPETPPRIQCSQPFSRGDYNNSYWQNRVDTYKHLGKDPSRCGRFATHSIDGQLLCRRHAADKLLEKYDESEQSG